MARRIRTLPLAALLLVFTAFAATSSHAQLQLSTNVTLSLTAEDEPRCDNDAPDLQATLERLLTSATGVIDDILYAPPTPVANLTGARRQILGPNPNPNPPPASPPSSSDAQPLRIVFSTEDLTRAGGYCSSAAGDAPSYRGDGSRVSCSTQGGVLTDAKRARLVNEILPAALRRIQTAVSVSPVQNNIRPRSSDTCGPDFTIPESHTSNGVPNADLVVYVAASPIPGGAAAFAGACSTDNRGRAVIGRINFDPANLEAAGKSQLDIATHEIFHILGVSSRDMNAMGRTTTASKRQKRVTMVTTPTVRAAVREQTACGTLEGAELEDERQPSAGAAHWERKTHRDELMAAVPGGSMSKISLGFLVDMNVGYSINLDAAEPMTWNTNSGCGPFDNRCNTLEGLSRRYFCFDSPGSRGSRCTFDHTQEGACLVYRYSSELPQAFQYYSDPTVGGPPYMDGCPAVVAYSNNLPCSEVGVTGSIAFVGSAFSTIRQDQQRWQALRDALQLDIAVALGAARVGGVTISTMSVAAGGGSDGGDELTVEFTARVGEKETADVVATIEGWPRGTSAPFPRSTAVYRQVEPSASELQPRRAQASNAAAASVALAAALALAAVLVAL